VLLQARPQGLLMIVDELAGLFANMGRYSNGSDREFWLEAWNGDHYVAERQSRPPVELDYLLIGITGGFQPDGISRCHHWWDVEHGGQHHGRDTAWPRW
jgi:hypothetical protein